MNFRQFIYYQLKDNTDPISKELLNHVNSSRPELESFDAIKNDLIENMSAIFIAKLASIQEVYQNLDLKEDEYDLKP